MKLQKLKENLQRRGFKTKVCTDYKSLKEEINILIKDRTVGFGSSMTLEKLKIHEIAEKNAKKIFSHAPGEYGENERSALTADVFITSANAISMDGEIINIDGTGNRVAATCFGPNNVIYIIGKNKVAVNLQSALDRAKETAVKLAKHFNRKTPCVKTGRCEDCLSPECICSITTIHRKKPLGTKIYVFLVDEELGL